MNKQHRRYRQHGTGSLRKVGPDKWRIGYDISPPRMPRKQRFETIFGTKKEAADILRSRLESKRKHGAVEDGRLTFSELCIRFLESKQLSLQATTYRLYQRVIDRHIVPQLGHIRVRDLTVSHVTSLLDKATNQSRTALKGRSLGTAAVRNIRILVRAILRFALKQGIISRNVTDLVEPPAPSYVERSIVTLDNIRTIIDAARGTELEAVVPFALGTGLRRSEMCALLWRDIDLNAGTIRVQRAAANLDGKVVIKATKTRKSLRTDYLAPFVISVLRIHRQQQANRRKAYGLASRLGRGLRLRPLRWTRVGSK